MSSPLFSSVDCISLPVGDIKAALTFYHDRLGHKLVWRTGHAAGLSFGDGGAELVIREDTNPPETDIRVESAVEAAERFVAAGGAIVAGPFEIQIGKCVVAKDPWGNHLVMLDTSKGLLQTDAGGYVISEQTRPGATEPVSPKLPERESP